jgi:hypothetical protein
VAETFLALTHQLLAKNPLFEAISLLVPTGPLKKKSLLGTIEYFQIETPALVLLKHEDPWARTPPY